MSRPMPSDAVATAAATWSSSATSAAAQRTSAPAGRGGADLAGRGLEDVGPTTDQGHRGAVGHEGLGAGPADAGAAPGDEGGATGERERGVCGHGASEGVSADGGTLTPGRAGAACGRRPGRDRLLRKGQGYPTGPWPTTCSPTLVDADAPSAAPEAPPPDPHHVLIAVALAASVEAAAQARHVVRDLLQQGHRPDMVDTACLLTSELVANAVIHAGAPVELVVDLDRARLAVEVIDASTETPASRPSAEPARHQRAGPGHGRRTWPTPGASPGSSPASRSGSPSPPDAAVTLPRADRRRAASEPGDEMYPPRQSPTESHPCRPSTPPTRSC